MEDVNVVKVHLVLWIESKLTSSEAKSNYVTLDERTLDIKKVIEAVKIDIASEVLSNETVDVKINQDRMEEENRKVVKVAHSTNLCKLLSGELLDNSKI